MKWKTKHFVEESKALTTEFMKEFGPNIIEMDEDEFKLMKRCFNLINSAGELLVEQAEVMDKIYDKLNDLSDQISRLEKAQ